MRAGNASSARGAASLVAEAIVTTKTVLAVQPRAETSEVVVRADSAFYSRKVIRACRRASVRFSVTIRVDKKVRRTIEAIPADAWVGIEYPQPVWDDEQRRFVSRSQIAETRYTAFDNTPDAVTARLIVYRIPDLNKTGADTQGELFTVWRYHAAFTDGPFILIRASYTWDRVIRWLSRKHPPDQLERPPPPLLYRGLVAHHWGQRTVQIGHGHAHSLPLPLPLPLPRISHPSPRPSR